MELKYEKPRENIRKRKAIYQKQDVFKAPDSLSPSPIIVRFFYPTKMRNYEVSTSKKHFSFFSKLALKSFFKRK
jgi:hypothetical protein